MELLDLMEMALVGLLIVILILFMIKNRKLAKENKLLIGMLDSEDKKVTAASEREKVIQMYHEGENEEYIAKVLQMPLDKVEMIIKFDKLKNAQQHIENAHG